MKRLQFRACAGAAVIALGMMIPSASPTPVQAAGLADLFISSRVSEGCTQFISPYGAPVPVKYYLPNTNCPGPAVIVLHGTDGMTRYQDDYDAIGKGLAAKGYATFMVHYFEGAPGFQRPSPMDRALPDPAAFEPWRKTAEASVDFVRSLPCVDANRVGIMGMSLGGFIGTSVSANDARIRSLVVLSGGMPDDWSAKLKWMAPTLIIHGDHDSDVPVVEAYKMHDLLNRKQVPNTLRILPCEGHLPYRVNKDSVAKHVLCFFDSTL